MHFFDYYNKSLLNISKMSLLLLHYCDAPGDSRTTISAKIISQIFFVPLFPDKRVIGHRPLIILNNFVFLFVYLKNSLYLCRRNHVQLQLSRKPPSIRSFHENQKTVPTMEQAGVIPARHIVAKKLRVFSFSQ